MSQDQVTDALSTAFLSHFKPITVSNNLMTCDQSAPNKYCFSEYTLQQIGKNWYLIKGSNDLKRGLRNYTQANQVSKYLKKILD